MPTMQTRRRFLRNLPLATTAVLLRAPAVPAAQGALETTSVRFAGKSYRKRCDGDVLRFGACA
jgi:hypothetical protein